MTSHTPSDPAAEAVSALRELRTKARDCIGETIPLRRRWVSAIMERVVAPLLADIAALRTRAEEAEKDRDALLAATGFKPGPLGEGLKRDVVLTDISGLRGEMVRARQAERRSEGAAMLWEMRMLEEWPGDTLLLRVWRQRKKATADRDRLATELAEARAKVADLREALVGLDQRIWTDPQVIERAGEWRTFIARALTTAKGDDDV